VWPEEGVARTHSDDLDEENDEDVDVEVGGGDGGAAEEGGEHQLTAAELRQQKRKMKRFR